MRIDALVLSHFRSHFLTRFEFDGRPVAIIGPNGAGKTNLIEAISLLSPGRGLRGAMASEIARRPETLGWRVETVIESGGRSHEISLRAEGSGARAVKIDGKPAPQSALATLLRVVWLVPAMDRLWIEQADARRRFIDRIALSFIPDHGSVSLSYEKAMRERNRLLKDQVSDPSWYSALEKQMAELGARIMQNRTIAMEYLLRAQEEAPTPFPKADLELRDPPGDPFDADTLARSRVRDLAAGRTLVGPHRADLEATFASKGIPAGQCSTGEQKALLISLILANARAIRHLTGEAPVLLLDEISAHLDAQRRADLYAEIENLGAHAFMTGTEASLFDAIRGRAQFLYVLELDGRTVTDERPVGALGSSPAEH